MKKAHPQYQRPVLTSQTSNNLQFVVIIETEFCDDRLTMLVVVLSWFILFFWYFDGAFLTL